MVSKYIFVVLFGLFSLHCAGQGSVRVSGVVADAADKSTLASATVSFQGKHPRATFTNADGRFSLDVVAGESYVMKVSYVGYESYKRNLTFTKSITLYVNLKANLRLSEVTVTAKEAQGLVTRSIIGRDAMNQLQPNSIADLMELLPGGYSKDPNMGVANTIALRETGTITAGGALYRNNDFAISSLGTQFIVDGAPVNTDANLQFSPLSDTQRITSGSGAENNRNITNKGVDMRTIGTDDIERVEVVRGIPSVEYGNLTSGIVDIKKIRRKIPLSARFKADGYSKLFSLGKGIAIGTGNAHVLNVDLGYLDSKIDPTDNLENYKRVNASLRYTFRKTTAKTTEWKWESAFDYSGSFDNSKADPDLNYGRIDEYRSNYNRMVFTNSWSLKRRNGLLREVEVNTSVSQQLDRLREKRLVAPQRYGIVPTGWEEGEREAAAVYAEYVADYLCDGKPFNAWLKAKGLLRLDVGKLENRLKAGFNWDYSKNYGNGQVYDMSHPLSVNGWSARPRRYKDIPGLQNLAVFGEENFVAKIGGSVVEGMLGLRLNTIPALDKRFDMSGKVYADPRVNLNWRLPYFTVAGSPLRFALSSGWGLTTKNPTLNYLYPDNYYSDFVELAYYDTKNPEWDSRFVVMSYKQDPTNYAIKPARNRKWEVRLDIDWKENSLSVDYFYEQMTSGFRYSRIYGDYLYKKYDAAQMAAGTDWHTLPFKAMHVLDGYQQASNGSKMVKQGIELQFTSARIRALRTRFNINGAWFHTTYTNSQPMFDPVSTVIDNRPVSESYVGLYDWNEGRVNDRLNTNFTLDTQVPEWGFIFTTSVQCMWLIKTKRQEKNGYPIAYISAADGKLHPYTPESEQDVFLKQLVQTYKNDMFRPFTVPMSMIINLKATKRIGRYMRLSFFANKILDYLPDYKSNGKVIRRNSLPYFGVEANLTI